MRLSTRPDNHTLTPALPDVFPGLATAGVKFRRGQLSLTVAAPGVGKSMFWLTIAERAQVPAIYFSADTDQHDATLRVAAMWGGRTMLDIEQQTRTDDGREWVNAQLAHGRHVDWVFDASLTGELVGERVNAFAEVHGQWPHLVVVDNLSNTVVNDGDALAEQTTVVKAMQVLGRQTGAHIAVLHHAKGEYESGNRPIPLGGVLNNQMKVPSLGLTLHNAEIEGRPFLGVNAVKNRSGRADPNAKHPILLDIDFSRATIHGYAEAA